MLPKCSAATQQNIVGDFRVRVWYQGGNKHRQFVSPQLGAELLTQKVVSAEGIESALSRSFKYLQSTDGTESTNNHVEVSINGLQMDRADDSGTKPHWLQFWGLAQHTF